MTQAAAPGPVPSGPAMPWCQVSPEDTAAHLGVDPAKGLSAAQAADLATKFGPNSHPAEKAKPEWRRFVDEYRSSQPVGGDIRRISDKADPWSPTGRMKICR